MAYTVVRTVNNTDDPITDSAGTPLAAVTIKFKLFRMDYRTPAALFDAVSGEYITGDEVSADITTGLFTVDLWPNTRGEFPTVYRVTIDREVLFIRVEDGAGPVKFISTKAALGTMAPQEQSLLASQVAIATEQAAIATDAADTADAAAVDTAADRVQTGLDVIATAADRAQTTLDAAATAADRVQTGIDAQAAADALAAIDNFVEEAPVNGSQYARKDGAWNVVAATGEPTTATIGALIASATTEDAIADTDLFGFSDANGTPATVLKKTAWSNIKSLLGTALSTLGLNNTWTGTNLFKPANSTTALQVQKADATPVFVVDTVNSRFGVGIIPDANMVVKGIGIATAVTFKTVNSDSVAKFTVLDNGSTTISNAGSGGAFPALTLEGNSAGANLWLYNVNAAGYSGFELQSQVGGTSNWRAFIGVANTSPHMRINLNAIPFQIMQSSAVKLYMDTQGCLGLSTGTAALDAKLVVKAGATATDKVINVLSSVDASVFSVDGTGKVTGASYKLSALNTAPASATATGTLGEVRIAADYIYVCVATNTWVRSALTTW